MQIGFSLVDYSYSGENIGFVILGLQLKTGLCCGISNNNALFC